MIRDFLRQPLQLSGSLAFGKQIDGFIGHGEISHGRRRAFVPTQFRTQTRYAVLPELLCWPAHR
jgi:hypothetical protein